MVIACINQKGGCGKSSTCFHLGGCLADRGYRVLLVDADPQGSLGQAFFGSEWIEGLAAEQTLASAFGNHEPAANALARATQFDRLRIVCANSQLAAYNIPNPHLAGVSQWRVNSLLENLPRFDIVLIDCPPNLYQCSWNAMLAADMVLVPVPPEDFGVQGLRAVQLAYQQAQDMNPRLQTMRYLITRATTRLIVHRMYEQQLRQFHGGAVFDVTIPEAVAFKVALTCRAPVTIHQPNSVASASIRNLADEIQPEQSVALFQGA
jgi:chromosome partitioning protein